MAITKKFLVGVGNVNAYNPSTGDLLFTSKTMLDNTITTTTSSTPITSGQGNQLQYIYFHTSKMAITLTETQFSLAMIAQALGSSINTGKNIWFEETVTLGAAGAGTVTKIPLLSPDTTSTIYGWISDSNGVNTKITFTGQNFTLAGGTSGQIVTVRYYENNAAAQSIIVNANIIPSIVRLVIDAQEGSQSAGTGIIGSIQVEIDRLQLDGTNTLTLKSNGVADTSLKGDALSFVDPITQVARYATITEILTNANWYDNVGIITSTVNPILLNTANSPYTLDLRAIPNVGNAFKMPYADLTFVSGTPATATISASGVLTKVIAGSTVLTVSITNKPSVTTTINVTVS